MPFVPRPGRSFPLGATVRPEGVNFSVFSRRSTAVELLLFDAVDGLKPVRVIPLDPRTGAMVEGGIGAQTRQVLENLRAVLEAAGSSMAKVVRVTVYMTHLGDFAKMNEVFSEYFPQDKPARSTVGVAALPRGALVEMDVIARA